MLNINAYVTELLISKYDLPPRKVAIFMSLMGWDGSGVKTLQLTGNQFDLSRERVRQIKETVVAEVRHKRCKLEPLMTLLSNMPLPISIAESDRYIATHNTGAVVGIKEVIAIIHSLGGICPISYVSKPDLGELIIHRNEMALLYKITDAMHATKGCQKPVSVVAEKANMDVATVLQYLSAVTPKRIIEDEGEHFVLLKDKDIRLLSTIDKLSVIVSSITISDLADANRRKSRGAKLRRESPTPKVILQLLSEYKGVSIEGEVITLLNHTTLTKDHLSEIETCAVDTIKPGIRYSYRELADLLMAQGFSAATVNWCVFSSPLIQGGDDNWGLRKSIN